MKLSNFLSLSAFDSWFRRSRLTGKNSTPKKQITLILALLTLSIRAFGQSNWKYTDLHDFGGTFTNADGTIGYDGAGPEAGVTFDSEGNMYGTTFNGGPNGDGMVWELTKVGVYKDLHDFGGTVTIANGTAGPDGVCPIAGVTLDSSGNLYGTTFEGGGAINFSVPNTGGIVWEITNSGVYRDLHDFGGTVNNANGKAGVDGFNPYAGVTLDRAGNMYGTTYRGGASADSNSFNSGGIVWEITNSGVYRDLHDFDGTVTNADGAIGPDGICPQGSVTFDGAGSMYGTTVFGGSNGGGIVWKITDSELYKDLHDFGGTVNNADGTAGSDGADPLAGVTFDSAGNMYGTAEYGGPIVNRYSYGPGMVWEITSTGAYKDLHDFGGTVMGADGTVGPDGAEPLAGVTFDDAGNMYGTTYSGGGNGLGVDGAGLVWEITNSGVYLDLHDFGGTVVNANGKAGIDGWYPEAGVAFDSSGIMHGTAWSGGPNDAADGGVGMLWSLTPSVGASLKSLSVSPTSVLGGNSSVGTLTLASAAASGGQTVSLSSSSSLASVPASVTVASGATTATFTITTSGVNSTTTATITAVSGSISKSASLTIASAVLSSLSLSPTAVGGGVTSTGTVTLSGPAGSGGTSVALTSSSSSAVVSSTATVPAGKSSGTFTVTTKSVSSSTTATITASLNGMAKTAGLTISPPALASVSVSPSSVSGGNTSTGTVTLSGIAGSGGFVVALSSNNAAAKAPKSVTVAAGQSQATFAVSTTGVSVQKVATITAKSGAVSKTATLSVNPPSLVSFSLNPTTLAGGASSTGTLTLSGPAPTGGMTVKLSSGSKSAVVTASVTVASGKTSATFTVKTAAVATNATVALTASLGGVSKTATLSISAPALTSLTLNPASVAPGKSSTGTVKISSAAPTGGLVVALSSSQSGATVPKTVTIPAGKTSITFTVKTTSSAQKTAATISAALGGTTKTAVLTIS